MVCENGAGVIKFRVFILLCWFLAVKHPPRLCLCPPPTKGSVILKRSAGCNCKAHAMTINRHAQVTEKKRKKAKTKFALELYVHSKRSNHRRQQVKRNLTFCLILTNQFQAGRVTAARAHSALAYGPRWQMWWWLCNGPVHEYEWMTVI